MRLLGGIFLGILIMLFACLLLFAYFVVADEIEDKIWKNK